MNILVKDAAQVDRALSGKKNPALFLCANRAVYDYCAERALPCFLLDEENIRDEYRPINTWALEKTFSLIEKFSHDQKKSVYLDSNFMYLEGLFAQVLKIVLILEDAVQKKSLREIVMPRDKTAQLSEVCALYVKNNRPGWNLVLTEHKKRPGFKAPDLKAAAYAILVKAVNARAWLKLKKAKRSGRKIALVSGGINHLSALAEKIKSRGEHEIVFCENTFTLEKFRFCRSRGYIFLTLPGHKKSPFGPKESFFNHGDMVYRGTDYTGLFNDVFAGAFESGFFSYWFNEEKLSALFRTHDPAFVLLDEDMGPRRLFLTFAGLFQKKCFVVSHGIPGILLQNKESEALMGRYESGTTFVQSGFEKSVYEGICYKPEKMIEMGVPRYDEIFHIKKGVSSEPRKVKNILYCASSMTSRGFDDWWPWLGFKNFFGEYTKRYTGDVLRALAGRPDVLLKIKPHYSDEAAIRELVRGLAPGNLKYEVLTHKANIFKLEAEADLIITPESSVICEGIMFEKPVLVLNYTPEPLMAPYDKDGLSLQVRNADELSAAIGRNLDSTDYLSKLAVERRRFFREYAGPLDGKSADRAADYILKNKPGADLPKKSRGYEAALVL